MFPQDTLHHKVKDVLAHVLQPGLSKCHWKSQEQHSLALLFLPALLSCLDVKAQAKIKQTLKKSVGGSGKQSSSLLSQLQRGCVSA